MAVINIRKSEVQVKIVYVGPGRGGKTTNLDFIFANIRHRIQSDMVSIKTHGDRTLFFDFLPFELGQIQGYKIKTQLYTVPGQVKYNATRKLVLKGVDGVVFVADSMEVMREKNIQALENLKENLAFYDIDGRWSVENEGVPPDIEVEMTPKLVIQGQDPQLERAVEEALRLLEKNPVTHTPRPASIDRVSKKK